MEIVKLSASVIREKVLNKEITCEEVVKAFIEQIEKNKEYNAVLEVFSDAVDYAKEIDKQIANGANGKLAGVPVIVRDNILVEGKTGSCGSNMLKNFVPHYSLYKLMILNLIQVKTLLEYLYPRPSIIFLSSLIRHFFLQL